MTYEAIAQMTDEDIARLTDEEKAQHIAVIQQRIAELEQQRQRIEQRRARRQAQIRADARRARAVLLYYGLPVPIDTV